MTSSDKDELVKEERIKIIEKMDEIEKRMEYLLQKERKKLLDEVDESVIKRKSLMPNLEDE